MEKNLNLDNHGSTGIKAARSYNEGVALFGQGKYQKAKMAFQRCYQTGCLTMQAAYAGAMCDAKMGRKPVITEELRGREDETGVVFMASNLVGYLAVEGHSAVLEKTGETSEIDAMVKGCKYNISVSSDTVFGGFFFFAYRMDGDRRLQVWPRVEEDQTEIDKYIIPILKQAAYFPLYPLPEKGIPLT